MRRMDEEREKGGEGVEGHDWLVVVSFTIGLNLGI